MPKSEVNDLITDQEMAFARLILSGTMTDRDAAQAAGLNPDTAAYTKAKPRVRAYMLEHRAAVEQKLAEQQTEAQRRLNFVREQVLNRLFEIAAMSPEMTRGSITGQVKALSMIVAIEGLIPDPRAASAAKKSIPLPNPPQTAHEKDGAEPAHPSAPCPGADAPEMPQNGQKISNFIESAGFSTARETAILAPNSPGTRSELD